MPTSGTVARIRTEFTGVAGSPAYSNLYFDASTLDAGVYQTAVLDMWGALTNLIEDGVTATMINPIPIIDVTTGQVVDVAVGDGGSAAMADSGDPLPPMTNGLMQFHTGTFVGGREIRGRSFVPYPTEAANTGGGPNSTYKTAVLNAFDAMNGSGGANGAFCIYSRAHHRFEYVSSMTIWDKWGSLRSRRD